MKQLAFFTAFGVFAYYMHFIGKQSDIETYAEAIRSKYNGVVIEKYRRKTDYIKIYTANSIIDIPLLSPELQRNVLVGDSIEKIALKNECVLVKNGKAVHAEYMFISGYIRSDTSWPKDLSHIVASD